MIEYLLINNKSTLKMKLIDEDLLNNKYYYSIELLEKNVDHLNKKILLSTQKLTAEFCIKYILDDNIDGGSEDTYIFDVGYILGFQKHLNRQDFM